MAGYFVWEGWTESASCDVGSLRLARLGAQHLYVQRVSAPCLVFLKQVVGTRRPGMLSIFSSMGVVVGLTVLSFCR